MEEARADQSTSVARLPRSQDYVRHAPRFNCCELPSKRRAHDKEPLLDKHSIGCLEAIFDDANELKQAVWRESTARAVAKHHRGVQPFLIGGRRLEANHIRVLSDVGAGKRLSWCRREARHLATERQSLAAKRRFARRVSERSAGSGRCSLPALHT